MYSATLKATPEKAKPGLFQNSFRKRDFRKPKFSIACGDGKWREILVFAGNAINQLFLKDLRLSTEVYYRTWSSVDQKNANATLLHATFEFGAGKESRRIRSAPPTLVAWRPRIGQDVADRCEGACASPASEREALFEVGVRRVKLPTIVPVSGTESPHMLVDSRRRTVPRAKNRGTQLRHQP